MIAQLMFLKCNNNSLWNGRLHDNKFYFVLLIAVVLLLVKFLQVSDSLWLSQNHKSEQHSLGLIMQKCRSLVSEKVSISLLRGLGLVSVSWRCGKISVSVSFRSRLGLVKMWKDLGLGLVSYWRTNVSLSHHKVLFTSLSITVDQFVEVNLREHIVLYCISYWIKYTTWRDRTYILYLQCYLVCVSVTNLSICSKVTTNYKKIIHYDDVMRWRHVVQYQWLMNE